MGIDHGGTPVDWYRDAGPLTRLGGRPHLPDRSGARDVRDVVQGLVVHNAHRHRYGLASAGEREAEEDLRPASEIVGRILALDPAPLMSPRAPERQLNGSCRTFTVLMCSLLRQLRIPARARCGYWAYFGPSEFSWEHWVCEYWDDEVLRWKLVDAQLDEVQIEGLATEGHHIGFDPLDVPRDRFLVAGAAWRLCRAGDRDPEQFGIGDLRGLGFIRDDVIRDVAALNKVELLPGDGWGRIIRPDLRDSAEDIALIDHLAAITSAPDLDGTEVRAAYEADPLLRPTETVYYLGPRARRADRVPELT